MSPQMRETQTKRRPVRGDARCPSDESGLGAVRDLKLARISEIGDQAMVASAQALAPLMRRRFAACRLRSFERADAIPVRVRRGKPHRPSRSGGRGRWLHDVDGVLA